MYRLAALDIKRGRLYALLSVPGHGATVGERTSDTVNIVERGCSPKRQCKVNKVREQDRHYRPCRNEDGPFTTERLKLDISNDRRR